MTIRFFLLSCCFCAFTLLSAPAATAQEQCGTLREAIENLRAPRKASTYSWDIFYGDADREEDFSAFYPLEEDKILTAGTITQAGKTTPFVTVFDRRNRPVWSWGDRDTKGGPRDIRIERILPLADKEPAYLLAGRYIPASGLEKIWIGRFDIAGKKLDEHLLSDNKRNLRFRDLIRNIKGTGWVLAAQVVPKDAADPVHSRVSGLNTTFGTIWSRDFVTGTRNDIAALAIGRESSANRFYIGAGSSTSDDNRTQALVLRFDSQGDIDWQRQFSRGRAASLTSAAFTGNGELLVGGGVQAADETVPGGGWLMNIDPGNGQKKWERYYARPDTAYEIAAIRAMDDGRVSLALNGTVAAHEDDQQSHARLILLSPRGDMLNDDTFTAGADVSITGHHIDTTSRRLYVGGKAQIEHPDPNNPATAQIVSDQAWLVVREAYSDYNDPCPGGAKIVPAENKARTP